MNDKRVERIWRCERLKVPTKQPPLATQQASLAGAPGALRRSKGRLWLADGSCVRLRPEYRDHVWTYDFVEDRTHDGRKFRTLNVVDEFTRECLAIRVARKLSSTDVIDVLSDLFILRGVPGHIRSDNGPKFIAQAVQDRIKAVGSNTAYIALGTLRWLLHPASPAGASSQLRPWENGYVESFNARFRDELLDGEIFYSLREAQVIESWRRHFHMLRPHGSIGYRPPAPEVMVPTYAAWPATQPRPAPPARLPMAPRPTVH